MLTATRERSEPVRIMTATERNAGPRRNTFVLPVESRQTRAYSCPEVDSALLFNCSASHSSEPSVDEETLDDEREATAGGATEGIEKQSRCECSEQFWHFFTFLDDAHALGYAVEPQMQIRSHNGVRRSSDHSDDKTTDFGEHNSVRRRRPERNVALRQPSHERCQSNSPLLARRISYYDSMRKIERLRKRYGVPVS